MERALLVTIKLKSERSNWRLEDVVQEMEELAFTSGVEVAERMTVIAEKPTANLFIGSGKAQEIAL